MEMIRSKYLLCHSSWETITIVWWRSRFSFLKRSRITFGVAGIQVGTGFVGEENEPAGSRAPGRSPPAAARRRTSGRGGDGYDRQVPTTPRISLQTSVHSWGVIPPPSRGDTRSPGQSTRGQGHSPGTRTRVFAGGTRSAPVHRGPRHRPRQSGGDPLVGNREVRAGGAGSTSRCRSVPSPPQTHLSVFSVTPRREPGPAPHQDRSIF